MFSEMGISNAMTITIAKAARAAGKKTILVQNKVKIDGRFYTVDQIYQLPTDCNPSLACVKEDEQSICFFW
jgi:hypothetical protein